jgi:hypothetical protein
MRKTLEVTISAEGRDKGRVYLITEMPATQLEKWAARALLALASSGVYIPEDVAQAGIAGIARLGLQMLGGIKFPEAEPLMDEMMACVQYRAIDRQHPDIPPRPLNESDIEEVATRVQLRKEWFTLHTGFSIADALSRLNSESTSAGSLSTETPPA